MHNRHLDFVALGGSLFITFAILGLFYSYILVQKDHEFDLIARDLESGIENRLINYGQILYATQGLFLSSDQVTEKEWRTFVQNQRIEKRFPGVQLVGYSQKIGNSEDLESHIQQMQLTHPDYVVYPDSQREEYHSIVLIEPINTRNLKAFGYDMFTESTRRIAMEQARDTSTVTISGKVTLVQEIDQQAQPGFLMYLPVYENDQPHQSIEEKQNSLHGFVYCAFRTYDLFDAVLLPILFEMERNDIQVRVYDTEKSDSNLLYASEWDMPESDWSKTRSLEYGHRTWVLEFNRTRTFNDFETIVMVAVPIIGVSMSAFVFIAIRSNQ